MSTSDEIALQKVQSRNSDIRCNKELQSAARQTTSRSDYDERYLVANQVQAIYNRNIGPAARISTSLFGYITKNQYIFRITYADGGWEWWTISLAVGASIAVLPHSNTGFFAGDGVVKPSADCPNYG